MTGLHIVDSVGKSLMIFCDNSVVVFHTKNNEIFSGTKHLGLKYLTIRDMVKEGAIVVEYINTNFTLVDP